MTVLNRMANWLRPTPQARPPATDDVWYVPVGTGTASGSIVTPEAAMFVTAVMECVNILAQSLAALPLNLYRKTGDNTKEKATDVNLWNLLHNQPNGWQTSFEWREMSMGHLGFWGNAYSEIISNNLGQITALEPIHPTRVECERLSNGKIRYIVTLSDNTFGKRTISQDDMFHVRGYSDSGIKGMSPIALASEAVGHIQAADEYGARFFGSDARPGGILEHPQSLSDKAKNNLKASWASEFGGSKQSHKPQVLEEGMTWKTIGVSPDEAQFLETVKYRKSDVAAFYRVPPHMIGLMEDATFDNITQQSQDFVTFTMLPWFVRWEAAILRDLIVDEQQFFAEFLVDALLRGDALARAGSLQIQKQNGALSANEWRQIENRNPIEGGDEFTVAANIGGGDQTTQNNSDTTATATVAPIEAMEHVIEDAAKRIAAAEIREINKRIAKAEDDRDKFNAWIEAFFNGTHRRYTAIVLAPLVAHWQREAGCLMDAGALEAEIIDNMVVSWQRMPVAGMDFVLEHRTKTIEKIITQGMQNAVSKSN